MAGQGLCFTYCAVLSCILDRKAKEGAEKTLRSILVSLASLCIRVRQPAPGPAHSCAVAPATLQPKTAQPARRSH